MSGPLNPDVTPGSIVTTPTGEQVRTNVAVEDPNSLRLKAIAAGYPEWATNDQGFLFAFSKGTGVDQDTGKPFNMADRWVATTNKPEAASLYPVLASDATPDQRAQAAKQLQEALAYRGMRELAASRDAASTMANPTPQQGFTPTESSNGPETGGWSQNGDPLQMPAWAATPQLPVLYAYPTSTPTPKFFASHAPIDMTDAPPWLQDIERIRAAKVLDADTNHDPQFTQHMAAKINVELAKAHKETEDRKRVAYGYLRALGMGLTHPWPIGPIQ